MPHTPAPTITGWVQAIADTQHEQVVSLLRHCLMFIHDFIAFRFSTFFLILNQSYMTCIRHKEAHRQRSAEPAS